MGWIKVEISIPPTETELWLWNGKVVYHGEYHWTFTPDGKARKEYIKKIKTEKVTHWQRVIKPEPPQS